MKSLDGDDFIVVGGYESGVDVAYHLGVSRQTSAVVRQGVARGRRRVPIPVSRFPRLRSNGCVKTSLLSKWNCFRTLLSNRSLAWTPCMKLRLRTGSGFKPACRHYWQADLRGVTS